MEPIEELELSLQGGDFEEGKWGSGKVLILSTNAFGHQCGVRHNHRFCPALMAEADNIPIT
ncbi:hypothetical protein J6590_033515 [Homalodisca vitripennis]|nr:hypothetical protein J6590_033515 [Homalodisca vitripennis]